MTSGESDDLRRRPVDRPRLFVRADSDQGVEHVGHCHDPCRTRNLQPGDAQVTAAVPPLVMIESDLLGHLQDWAGAPAEDGGTQRSREVSPGRIRTG